MGGHWNYTKIKYGDHLTVGTQFMGLSEPKSIPPSVHHISLNFKWELNKNISQFE